MLGEDARHIAAVADHQHEGIAKAAQAGSFERAMEQLLVR